MDKEKVKELLNDGEFQSGYEIGTIHHDCSEVEEMREKAKEVLLAYTELLLDHHERCDKR